MNLDLSGKHALVCGGSQGIGLAAGIELARLGAHVTLLARSRDALEAAAATLPKVNATQTHASLAVDMNHAERTRFFNRDGNRGHGEISLFLQVVVQH